MAFCLLCYFVSIGIEAQNYTPNEFLGIPIVGTVRDFAKQLTQKGFTYEKDFDGKSHTNMSGEFYGIPCFIVLRGAADGGMMNVEILSKRIYGYTDVQTVIQYVYQKLVVKYGEFENLMPEDFSPVYISKDKNGWIGICGHSVDKTFLNYRLSIRFFGNNPKYFNESPVYNVMDDKY